MAFFISKTALYYTIYMACSICNYPTDNKLCTKHTKLYVWDSSIQGFRLKKKNNGSRYTTLNYHKTETKLVKLVEQIYGLRNVVTSFHPKWAVSPKGVLLEYDILVKNTKLLIEYNGRQHYEYVKFFHKTKEQYKKQIYRDRLKKQLAENNGYTLVVIKNTEPITKQYIQTLLEKALC